MNSSGSKPSEKALFREPREYDLRVWCFDGSTRRAGCDHAVRDGEDYTLCGRRVNGGGVRTSYPVSQEFDPEANYSCKRCRRAVTRV